MKLTKATVARLKLPPAKTDVIYFDDELPGFGIRLRAGGKRTWVIQYRIGTKQRRVTLGTVKLPDGSGTLDTEKAREAARNRLALVTLGSDPQQKKQEARARAAITLGVIIQRFLAHKEKILRAKSYVDTRRYLLQYWKPLHPLAVHGIERRDVAARLSDIAVENGPVAAARARVALSALFAWAVREGICDENPVNGTNKPPEPKSRDRILSDAELAEIWAACRDDYYGKIVKLAILTAARREEIGGLAWAEIDLDGAVFSLPGARTKNGRPHQIPLAPLALSIIKSVERREGTHHLFGQGAGGFSGWSKAKRALDARIVEARRKAAAKGGKVEVVPMTAWRLHDLRRTAATTMNDRLGVMPHIVEAVLNHVGQHKAGVAGVYNRAEYMVQKRAALVVWADYVNSVVEGSERKVVPLVRSGIS